jgi:hypothetical protein
MSNESMNCYKLNQDLRQIVSAKPGLEMTLSTLFREVR